METVRHFDKDQMSTQRRLERGKYPPRNDFFSPTHLQDDVLCFFRLDKHTEVGARGFHTMAFRKSRHTSFFLNKESHLGTLLRSNFIGREKRRFHCI